MTTGLDTGTYDVLRDRLAAQAGELARRAEALNTRRTEQFGSHPGRSSPAPNASAPSTTVCPATSSPSVTSCSSDTTSSSASSRRQRRATSSRCTTET